MYRRTRTQHLRALFLVMIIYLLGGGLLSPHVRPVQAQTTPRTSIFGADLRSFDWNPLNGFPLNQLIEPAQTANLSWVRAPHITWEYIEGRGSNGAVIWNNDVVLRKKQQIKDLINRGFRPIVNIIGFPSWASKTERENNWPCGVPKTDAGRADFRNFVRRIATQFNDPNDGIGVVKVSYWQIGNEPDHFNQGCHVRDQGIRYAQMLMTAVDELRAANSTTPISIFVGGLALEKTPQTSTGVYDFLDGFLSYTDLSGRPIRNFFDTVDYHSYTWWDGVSKKEIDVVGYRGWPEGAQLGKLKFIRDKLSAYGSGSKSVFLGETGVLCSVLPQCYNNTPTLADFKNTIQPNYVLRYYSRAWANGIIGVDWFTLGQLPNKSRMEQCGNPQTIPCPGEGPPYGELHESLERWYANSELIDVANDGSLSPRKAYYALQQFSTLLQNATFVGQLAGGTGLEGYAFYDSAAQKEYRVYWTNDGSQQSVVIPIGSQIAYSVDNVALSNPLPVGFNPIMIQYSIGTNGIDDTSQAIRYSGVWEAFTGVNRAALNTIKRTNTVGSKAEFTFKGSRISYLYSMAADRGTAKVSIDGIEVARITARTPDPSSLQRRQSVSTWNVPYGEHRIEIEALGGGYIDVDMLALDMAYANPGSNYDDLYPSIKYYSSWVKYPSEVPNATPIPNAANGTVTYSDTAGDLARMSFYGSQVSIVLSTGSNRSKAAVTIDGNPNTCPTSSDVPIEAAGSFSCAYLNLYSNTTVRGRVVTYNLSPGYHTIHIFNMYGATSSQIRVDIDEIRVR